MVFFRHFWIDTKTIATNRFHTMKNNGKILWIVFIWTFGFEFSLFERQSKGPDRSTLLYSNYKRGPIPQWNPLVIIILIRISLLHYAETQQKMIKKWLEPFFVWPFGFEFSLFERQSKGPDRSTFPYNCNNHWGGSYLAEFRFFLKIV